VPIRLQGVETWAHELYRFPRLPKGEGMNEHPVWSARRGHEWATQCVGHSPLRVVVDQMRGVHRVYAVSADGL
jgi:hypothetical protein